MHACISIPNLVFFAAQQSCFNWLTFQWRSLHACLQTQVFTEVWPPVRGARLVQSSQRVFLAVQRFATAVKRFATAATGVEALRRLQDLVFGLLAPEALGAGAILLPPQVPSSILSPSRCPGIRRK